MAGQKVYAVRKGRKTGLFTSWESCEASVSGFPGAQYKGFSTKEEAGVWLAEGREGREAAVEGLTAYVDGSFEESLGKYSFGCVLLTPEG